MTEFGYEEVREATNGFSLDRLIGKGSHGCVYRAVLKAVDVAVKKPSAGEPSKLSNEIEILSSCRSRHVVNIVGVARGPDGGRLLLMDYMPNGSLEELLHSSPDPPGWIGRVSTAVQVARALLGLHRESPPIIHRDVKSANILFDGRWRARLADFSLAARAGGPGLPAAGTLGYLDPGYTGPGQLGPAVDVFSFGVVLLELVTGRRAIDVRREPAGLVEWAAERTREGREVRDRRVEVVEEMEGVVGRMMRVAARCVEAEEWRRPGMEEVVWELEKAAESVRPPVCGAGTVWERVRRWVMGWRRRRRARRVTVAEAAATRIVCRKHLIMGCADQGGDRLIDGWR